MGKLEAMRDELPRALLHGVADADIAIDRLRREPRPDRRGGRPPCGRPACPSASCSCARSGRSPTTTSAMFVHGARARLRRREQLHGAADAADPRGRRPARRAARRAQVRRAAVPPDRDHRIDPAHRRARRARGGALHDAMLTAKDFATATPSWWCPGCGDYGVLSALKSGAGRARQAAARGRVRLRASAAPARSPGYLHSYAFHGVHGRALPVATAVKLANRDLTVIAAGGDGDGYAIGAGPLRARGAAQPGHHLHRDGQPDVRPDQGPGVADQRDRLRRLGRAPTATPTRRSTAWRWRSPPARRSSRAGSRRSRSRWSQLIKAGRSSTAASRSSK